MGRVLLCVDLSYQIYRAAAAHPNLSSRRTFTGGLYGFFTTLAKMIRDTRATDVVFCEDVKPYERSKTYPEYKQLRKKDADPELKQRFEDSRSLVFDALRAGNLPIWGARGFESDDLIAHAVRRYRHRFDLIYAGSNDSDLYQLFWCERFRVYRKSLADVMDREALLQATGLTPEQYMLVTALTGTHNDVAGIPRVGEVTAIKAVKAPQALRALMAAHEPLVKRNLALISLPHASLPYGLVMPTLQSPRPREIIRTLAQYDIDTAGPIERAIESMTEPR